MQGQALAAEHLAKTRAFAYQISTESPTAARLRFDHVMNDILEAVGPLLDFRRCPDCDGYGKARRADGEERHEDLPDCDSCNGRCAVPIPALSQSNNAERIADHVMAITARSGDLQLFDRETVVANIANLTYQKSDSLLFRILREGAARADGRARIEYEEGLAALVIEELDRLIKAEHDKSGQRV